MAAETRRELAWEKELRGLTPATLPPAEWSDPLCAEELLAAYNASLKRAQSIDPGRFQQNGIDYHVFFDPSGNKNVVTQPLDQQGRRLSHLLASLDGEVLRLSLEFSGQTRVQDLSYLMKAGIADFEDDELCSLPGYWLMLTRYSRQAGELVRVESSRRHYDLASKTVVELDELSLG